MRMANAPMNVEHDDSRGAMTRKEALVLAAIVLAAFALRLWAAATAPEEEDAWRFLGIAKAMGGAAGIPLGSGAAYHPLLSVYLLKLSGMVLGWGQLATRLPFVLLATASVWAFYMLVRAGLGVRVAQAAAALMAVDLYSINVAILRLPRIYVAFVPLVLWLFWCAIHVADRRRAWCAFLALGVASGLGYLAKESIALLAPPFAVFLVLNPKRRRWLWRWELYLAVLAALAIAAPSLAWNWSAGMPNFHRNVAKVSGLGLTPRPLVLYLGQLVHEFISIDRLTLLMQDQVFHPEYSPMSWSLGAFCLVATALACFRGRGPFSKLMRLVFAFVFVVSALARPQEPLNGFWWASITVFPALAFAGALWVQLWEQGRLLRALAAMVALAQLPALWTFLSADTFLDRIQSHYRGTLVRAFELSESNVDRKWRELVPAAARLVAMAPDDPHALAMEGAANMLAGALAPAKQQMDRALKEAPSSALAQYLRARLAVRLGDFQGSIGYLLTARQALPESVRIARRLGNVYLHLGRVRAAAAQYARALRIKPEDAELCILLATARRAMGDRQSARALLERALALEPGSAEATAYLKALDAQER